MPQVNQLATINAGQSLLQSRIDKAVQEAKAHGNAGDPELRKAAQAFESILLEKWLEEAHHSFASVPGQDPDQDMDPGADQFRSLAMQSLAENISAHGGIGIADMIIRQVSHSTEASNETSVDSKAVSPVVTDGVLPARNAIKVSSGRDR